MGVLFLWTISETRLCRTPRSLRSHIHCGRAQCIWDYSFLISLLSFVR